MKRYHIREGSPLWVMTTGAGILAFLMAMSIPSTIEHLMGVL